MARSTIRSSTASKRTLRTARWVSHDLVQRCAEPGEHLVDAVVGVATVDELDGVAVVVEPADRDALDVVVRHQETLLVRSCRRMRAIRGRAGRGSTGRRPTAAYGAIVRAARAISTAS